MLLLDNSIFPTLGMGNITLGKDKINVKAFFTAKTKELRTFQKNNSKLLAFSKVYFFLSVPKTRTIKKHIPANILTNPEKRIQNIAGHFNRSSLDAIEWYKYLSKMYPNNTISMDQIFGSLENMTSSELTKNVSISDINFEIDIPIQKELYDKAYHGEVHLHAFAHLDVSSMLEAGEISSINKSIVSYFKKGSNLKSKKILQKVGQELAVPTSREVLATLDNKPFYGKYKIYSGNTYVGATPQGKANVKLKKVEIPETSISAEFLIERDAAPPVSTPRQQNEEKLEYSFSKPFIETTEIEAEDSARNIYESSYARRIKQRNIITKLKNTNTGFITNAYHCVQTGERTSNSVYFDLQIEKIVKNKTEYGYLLQYLKDKKNISNIFSSGNPDSGAPTEEAILSNVKIKEIVIKRNRISENCYVANAVGTQKKQIDKTNEVVLARIRDFLSLGQYVDDNVSLTLVNNKTNFSKKRMHLKDYELCKNPRKGEYVYTIEITLEDEIPKYLTRVLSNFRATLKEYGKFLQELDMNKAHIPEKDKFREEKILRTTPDTILNEAIAQYLLILILLGKNIGQTRIQLLRQNLRTSVLQNSGGTVSGAYNFKDMCDVLLHDFEKLVGKAKTIILENSLYAKKVTNSVSSKDNSHQKYSFQIPGISKSVEDGSILVSYSNRLTEKTFISNNPRVNKGTMSVRPAFYAYKKGQGVGSLLNEAQLTSEENKTNTNNRALLLENAVKMGFDGAQVEDKIKGNSPRLELPMVFGIPGITIGIPTSEGVFATDSGKQKPTKEATVDLQSGLSSVLGESVASSTRAKSGKNRLKEQKDNENKRLETSLKRSSFLEKTLDLLSSIKNESPRTSVGSAPDLRPVIGRPALEKLFMKRAGIAMVGIEDDSGEMIFSPITKQTVDKIQQKIVIIKVTAPLEKTPKEQYFMVDNVFELPKKALQDFLKQRR